MYLEIISWRIIITIIIIIKIWIKLKFNPRSFSFTIWNKLQNKNFGPTARWGLFSLYSMCHVFFSGQGVSVWPQAALFLSNAHPHRMLKQQTFQERGACACRLVHFSCINNDGPDGEFLVCKFVERSPLAIPF